jgi:hypothetical protein
VFGGATASIVVLFITLNQGAGIEEPVAGAKLTAVAVKLLASKRLPDMTTCTEPCTVVVPVLATYPDPGTYVLPPVSENPVDVVGP